MARRSAGCAHVAVLAAALVGCGSRFTEGTPSPTTSSGGTSSGGTAGTGGSAGQGGGDGGTTSDGGSGGGPVESCSPVDKDAAFPAPGHHLLDDFERDDGELTGNWLGELGGFKLEAGQLVHVPMGGGDFIVYDEWLCADQELKILIIATDPAASSVDFLLKVGAGGEGNALSVTYLPMTGGLSYRYAVGDNWHAGPGTNAPDIVPGDSIGVRATSDGYLTVFHNDDEFGSAALPDWPHHGEGGRVGIAVNGSTGGWQFDNLSGR